MSKSFRGRLFAAIFSAGVGGAVIAGPAAAETLAEAIALAYDNNPTLQAQRATQRALDETYVQARAGYRPTVSLQARATYDEQRIPKTARANALEQFGIFESNSGSTTLSITQPVYTGGRVAAAVSAAEADILQGRENLRRVESQIMGSVIQAYVDVRRDQDGLRIQQDNLKVLTRQLDESNARFDVGEITKTDVAQSQARLAASQAQLQQAQAQLAISRANYAAVVGQNPGELEPEPSLAPLLPADVDTVFQIAEQNNPQIRAAEYAEQASRARLGGARAERLPNLALQGSVSQGGGPVDPFERERYSREVTGSVVLTMPLFNGGLTTSRVRQTAERHNVDRINIETARRSVLQGATQAWNQLVATRANVISTATQVSAARLAAEGTRQEQQVGLRTTIDVLNAEQEQRAAELAQIQARHDTYVASANILASMGRLEAKNLTPLKAQYDPKTNFNRLRITWGWVPWEEPLAIVDGALTPKTTPMAVEGPPAGAPVLTQPRPAN